MTDAFAYMYQISRKEVVERIKMTLAKLAPIKINSYGGICEWNEEYEEVDPGHRHISHLFALFPVNR